MIMLKAMANCMMRHVVSPGLAMAYLSNARKVTVVSTGREVFRQSRSWACCIEPPRPAAFKPMADCASQFAA